MPKSNFQEQVLEDANYIKYRSVLKSVKAGADLEKVKQESKNLHLTRTSRSLGTSRLTPDRLIAAEFQDSGNRSRLVELRVLLMGEQELLESAMSICKKHLKNAYADALSLAASTVATRNALVDTIFARGAEYLSQINLVLAIIDLYVKDIDAAGYKHSNVRELMKFERAGKEIV